MSKILFKDQVAVVTGAGRGLGEAYAVELARRGAAVIVNDIARANDKAPAADEVVVAIQAEGGRALASHHDISTAEGGQDLIQLAIEHYGQIDILINNAGFLRPAPFDEMSLEDIESVIKVHLLGAFHTSLPAWHAMHRKGYGRIILTSSCSAFGQEGNSNYSAAKAALIGLANTLALEGERHGIKANSIFPVGESRISADAPQQSHKNERLIAALQGIDGRRPPASVAHLVIYLASRECQATGTAYSAVAGRYARVFLGVTKGWLANDISAASPESIAEHIAEIDALDAFIAPGSAIEEIESVGARLVDTESRPQTQSTG